MAAGGRLAVMPVVASTGAHTGGVEDVACPGCGSRRRTALLVGRDPISLDAFPVVRCDECQLAYVTPRPDAKHLRAYYPTRYFGKRHPMFKRQLMALRTSSDGRRPGHGYSTSAAAT